MPSHAYHLTTEKPREDVFDVFADLREAEHWMPTVRSVEHVSGPLPVGVGSRYLVSSGSVMIDYEAVEVDRPRLVVWRVKHPKLEGTDRWTFTATADGGTAVEYVTDFEYTGVRKLASPFGSLVLMGLDGKIEKAMAERVDG